MIATTAFLIRQKMRRNKVTIRELAARLDMPMTWVRRGMKHGVSSDNALRDWMEAITQKS
jgi:Trp operon repressor